MTKTLFKFSLFITLLSLLFGCSEPVETPAISKSKVTSSEGSDVINSLAATAIPLDVYKSPSCGCCGKWVEHAEQRGFTVTIHHPSDLARIKAEKGIAPGVQSCHTAVSPEGYLFEGHIPARYIRDFLANPPEDARGLSVPAMPVGTPGMEVENRFTPYDVLLLKNDGSTELFAKVTSASQQY